MIDKALEFLVGELKEFLGHRFPGHEQHVILSALCNPDGSVPHKIENKIVLSLVNLERESAVPANGTPVRAGAGYLRSAPTLHLNLYVLVAASFGHNYGQALSFLNCVLAFFQGKPYFSPQNAAALPRELERLSVELVNMSLAEMNNLWAILGAKYMPSAVYRVRMVSIQQGWVTEALPMVSTPTGEVGT